jgi:ribosomal protein L29
MQGAELAALHELRAELAELRAELRSRREPRDPS